MPAPDRPGRAMLGIDPELMTRLIQAMRRAGDTLPDLDGHLDRTLGSVGLPPYAVSAGAGTGGGMGGGRLRDLGHHISAKVPDLQGRLDLILATPAAAFGGRGGGAPGFGALSTSGRGVIWADESAWLSKSPAAGAAAAAALAGRLRAEGKKGAINSQTLAELAKHQNDPYFAVAFAIQVPPSQLRTHLAALYRTHAARFDADGESQAEVERFAVILSNLIATATHGAGSMKIPRDYADRLIEHLDTPETTFALGKLLRHGRFDERFLRDLVTKIYDHERRQPPGSSYWLNLNPGVPPMCEVPPELKDPMTAVAAALANHPAVAQDFFTDPARRPLAYLMRERTWPGVTDAELGRALVAATTTYRDHGEPAGESRGHKSALIASWAVHFWNDESTRTNLPHTRLSVARIFAGYLNDLHRLSDGRFAEKPGVIVLPDPDPYLSGIQSYGAAFEPEAVKNVMTWAFSDPDAFGTVAAGHAQYSVDVLDDKAAELAAEIETEFTKWCDEHPTATPAEIAASRQEILESRMAGGGGQQFNSAVTSLSKTLFAITDAANIANITDAEHSDERFNAFRDIVLAVVDLVPGPSGQISSSLFESMKDGLSEQITTSKAEEARSAADTTLGEAVTLFEGATAAAMMRHGLFGDASEPAITHPHASVNYPKGSSGDFLANGQIIAPARMSDEQRDAYREWLNRPETGRVFRLPVSAIKDGFDAGKNYYTRAGE
ncbi:hypothetical protein HII36_33240 [Nonomuraea sp. NN258]|uniref:hypothetical protein n=1 Tax=Nonomuraea antri TaxID=2730852 RepID=UPI0015695313|nr:hypothetical protein [Nonomuraea antri]NRQ36664.1 hypothetical protein [Nonomuraea antri]